MYPDGHSDDRRPKGWSCSNPRQRCTCVIDVVAKALQHIYQSSGYNYTKRQSQNFLGSIMTGPGLVAVVGMLQCQGVHMTSCTWLSAHHRVCSRSGSRPPTEDHEPRVLRCAFAQVHPALPALGQEGGNLLDTSGSARADSSARSCRRHGKPSWRTPTINSSFCSTSGSLALCSTSLAKVCLSLRWF